MEIWQSYCAYQQINMDREGFSSLQV